ncbi:MAG: SDR family NAD(P)-dependent oxidoreductase, partial [Parvibaculaceae bacterium]
MDLGIKGRHALVCGGSKGLGRAAARALAGEGVNVTLVARHVETLDGAARDIRAATGVKVDVIPADVTTPEGRSAVLKACPDPDILITNPGKRQIPDNFRTMSRGDWDDWMEAHFYAALEFIRAVVPGMCERKFGRVVNISVSFIKFPQVNFGHSHAARLALAGAIAAMARELV